MLYRTTLSTSAIAGLFLLLGAYRVVDTLLTRDARRRAVDKRLRSPASSDASAAVLPKGQRRYPCLASERAGKIGRIGVA